MGWNFYNASGELQINDGGVQAGSAVFTGNVDLGSNLLVGNAGSTGIAISANGEVNMAAQPSFLAYFATTDSNETGDATTFVLGNEDVSYTELFDQNADFAVNGSDSKFTAPITGRYLLTASIALAGLGSAHTDGKFSIVTSNREYVHYWHPYQNLAATNGLASCTIAAIADMDASDTAVVKIQIRNGTKVVDIYGSSDLQTFFSGMLLA